MNCGFCDATTAEGGGLSIAFKVPRAALASPDGDDGVLPPHAGGNGSDNDAVNVSLNRPDAGEPCSKALARAAKTVEKALVRLQRGHRKGKRPPAAAVSVAMRLRAAPGAANGGEAVIDDAVLSGDAFADGALLEIDVGLGGAPALTRCAWTVRRDCPKVTAVVLPDLPLVEFPAVCVADTLHADSVKHVWSVVGAEGVEAGALARGKGTAAAAASPPLSAAAEFTPNGACLGRRLAVTVTPLRADGARGDPVTSVCQHPVHAVHLGALAPLDKRTGVPRPDGATLRVVTFNVQWGLGSARDHGDEVPAGNGAGAGAGVGAASASAPAGGGGVADAAKGDDAWVVRSVDDLPVSLQTRHYRQHTLLRELLGWAADVACLQEVTPPVHDAFLGPLLGARGFGSVRAGELALVWRRDRFELAGEAAWTVSELLDEPANREVLAAFQAVPHALEHFRGMPHQAQCVQLRPVGGGPPLVVVNVHLVMDEYGEHLRAVQAALILRQARAWAGLDDCDGRLVLAGDLNVRGPEAPFTEYVEAVLTLLCTGVVDADHPSFARGRGVGRPKPAGHRHSIAQRQAAPSVAPPDESGAGSACDGSGNGGDQAPRCSVKLSKAKAFELSCPNAATEAGGTCWDHACRLCGAPRHDFRLPVCRACSAVAKASGGDGAGWDLPPLPADIAADTLWCRLDTGGVVLDSARRALPRSDDGLSNDGDLHKFSFYSVPFHPPSGGARSEPFVELRDHVMFTPSTLRPVRFAPPPPAAEFRGRLPGLAWPSDHLSVAVDFCEL